MTESKAQKMAGTNRTIIIAFLAVAAFFGAYKFAGAISQPTVAGSTQGSAPSSPVQSVASSAKGLLGGTSGVGGTSAGAGCCGGGGAPVAGAATVEGNVQKISVDMSTGSYNPNVIKLKAGVPAEITFGQSGGCTAVVQSSELGFSEDLTSGPKTVKLQALKAGTYNFACGMNMATGQIVVE